ncbi:phytanoyl-CoA dioxygenase family protein [Fulvivirga sp. M361]|uniref:phytanoyl-CoA dioxygenase family protein n=1 Tax=Fulvivirga sp. M361 TaxID=2594266 RepID=UPI00117B0F42|nr:phytanoyl-CoA dioxygenase family protein [Fulvivirga sp. M361]TRX60627.1 phytanoyl-CoA dioxygenase family protein [Fulvivirga sp. M361]
MKLKSDLSLHHELVSDLFPKLSAKETWETYKLPDEQVAHFNEFGYLHNVKLLEENQVDHLKQELDEIMDPDHPRHHLFYEFHTNESEDPNSVLFHSLGHWRITRAFHDILWNPRFVVAASQLLGNKAVRFWHDQLFCKPAHHGGVVAWHQDYSYWTRTSPMQHLTCWVGLDDANTDNGCLHYIPKSHHWGLLDKPNLAGDMEKLNDYLTDDQKETFKDKVAIEMPKGYGSFHHPLLVHGSYENRSERSRKAFVLNVFADGTLSDSDEILLKGVPTIKKGGKMEGQYFPLLFDPKDIQN